MSHFTTIRTRLIERDQLLQALADLGYTVQQGPVKVKGFAGQTTQAEFKITIRQRRSDIGFRSGMEGYELIADWWSLRGFNQQDFVRQLQQRYAYHATQKALTAEGFTLVEEERRQDGSIHLLLRRAV